MTGEIARWSKIISRQIDEDNFQFEIHDATMAENSLFLRMEYTRKK